MNGHAQYPAVSADVMTQTCCVMHDEHGVVENAVEKTLSNRMHVASDCEEKHCECDVHLVLSYLWTPHVHFFVRDEHAKDKKSSPSWGGHVSHTAWLPDTGLKHVSALLIGDHVIGNHVLVVVSSSHMCHTCRGT